MTKLATNNGQLSNLLIITICAIVVGLSLVSSQIITPQNTAVNAGTPVNYLNCSYTGVNSNQFIWTFTELNTGSTNAIVIGCSSYFPQLYGVDCSIPNSNNLIILNAQPSQAGMYQCAPGGQQILSAQLIVMGGDVTCSTNPTVQVPVDQSVQLACGTQVYGNIKSVMTWSNSDGVTVPLNPSNSGANIGATASVQAQIPTVPSYTCSTKFNTGTSSATATNVPTYSSSCNTQPLQVFYPPTA